MDIDFSRFYETINEAFWDFFEDKSRVRISYGGAGSGKCLQKGTKVIMFSGHLKNVENVQPGDLLMGPDSKPRKVLECHSGVGNLYKVKQRKGIDYVVNENHILSLQKAAHLEKDKGEIFKSGNYRRPRGKYPDYPSIVNISIKEYLQKSPTWKRNFKGYRNKIDFIPKKIKLDPYFLGLWLGDGGRHRSCITTMDQEIIDYIYNIAKKYNLKVTINKKKNKASTYHLSTGHIGNKIRNPILDLLRYYNLIKNKHIPDEYLYNSRENRLKLLAGLLDTDGTMNGNCYSIIQKDENLLNQIAFLSRSLGFRCHVSRKKSHCMVKGERFEGDYYRANISGNVHEIPVKIKRKRIKNFNKNKDPFVTGISVEEYGYGEFFGFSLDEDHLFMLEDCTVVHNSYEAFQECIYKILAEPGHNYLICRKVANTNKTSTYALFKQVLGEMGLIKLFKENKSDMTFTVKETGYMVIFKGLDDIEKLKSITFPKGVLTDVIIEESSEITQKDFDQLNVRLRGRKPENISFQITLLLNPIDENHWIKKEFIDLQSYQKSMKVFILHTTYLDNKFIDEDYEAILEGYKDFDYEFYKVYCLGQWGTFGNIIFNNWRVEKVRYKEDDFDAVYPGMDFGSVHPSVILKTGFKDGVMYSFAELCVFDKTNMEFIEANKECKVLQTGEQCIADSAEPSRIKEWVQHGYSVIAAKKGKDSVSRGIDFIKSHTWIIDPSCVRLIQEVQIFRWKEDKKTRTPIEGKPVEVMDDAIKSCIYSLEPISRLKGKASVLSGSKTDRKKALIEQKIQERKSVRQIKKQMTKEQFRERRRKKKEKEEKLQRLIAKY